jgi:glycosyltransferase involved in cell wall biosynthesis
LKLAYVVPRYGQDVAGGAESAVRMLAEHLVASQGWSVEVLTTCARNAGTWADELPPGTSMENGVAVHRFASLSGRARGFDRAARPVMHGGSLSRLDEERLVEMQGPVSPDLVDAAVSSEADLVAFSPYLYHPIVQGVRRLRGRAVLHPAAHDEPFLRLGAYDDVFRSAGALVFYTHGERALVSRRFGVGATPQLVLGLGVDDPPAATTPLAVEGPYLLCVGRVDDSKGTNLLARAFAAYKARRPGPLKLVLVGHVVDRPPAHPDIVVAGPVSEEQKWGAYEGALALVQPSPYESFSLVLVEGWQAGLPALVNAGCSATREHVARSGGGLWFGSYAEFETALDRLVGDGGLRAALGERGRAYARASFAWPVLLERYAGFLSSVAGRFGR